LATKVEVKSLFANQLALDAIGTDHNPELEGQDGEDDGG